MEKRDKLYIQHIKDAIIIIEQYGNGVEFNAFLKNKLLQDGIVRELEIIGEAAKNVSLHFKRRHADIPWKDIVGMRDKLIHEYFGVDLEAVWKTAKEDILLLKLKLKINK